jgi:hypothetical protein
VFPGGGSWVGGPLGGGPLGGGPLGGGRPGPSARCLVLLSPPHYHGWEAAYRLKSASLKLVSRDRDVGSKANRQACRVDDEAMCGSDEWSVRPDAVACRCWLPSLSCDHRRVLRYDRSGVLDLPRRLWNRVVGLVQADEVAHLEHWSCATPL